MDAGIVIWGPGSSKDKQATPNSYFTCNSSPAAFKTFNFGTQASSETTAVFAHGDYRINDQWAVSGGLRYTEDEKTSLQNGYVFWYVADPVVFQVEGDSVLAAVQDGDSVNNTWDAVIGNISLEYTRNAQELIYGRISKGYRAGGFQTYSPGAPRDPIREETIWNYEVGYKGLFMDQRLQLTLGAFINDFDNYQINATQERPPNATPQPGDASPLVEFTDNIDGTKIWGLEIEGTYSFNERWRLSGFYAYLDSELGAHSQLVVGNPNATFSTDPFPRFDINGDFGDAGTEICTPAWVAANPDAAPFANCYYMLPVDLSGNQLPQQPNHKLALTLVHTMPLDNWGRIEFLGTYSYTGERYPDLGNLDIYEMPSYDRLDLRAAWTSADEKWNVTAYVQNVFDDIGLIQFLPQSTNGGANFSGSLTDQRQYGLQVRWQPTSR